MLDAAKLRISHVVLLCVFVVLAFLPSLGADFVNWDDESHLVDNKAVQSFQLKEIFTQTVQKVYIPLTMLSFAVERKLFGQGPFVYHLDNLLLHLANTLLVYWIIQKLGVKARAAFFAALIFGIHPMRVESVAWVTERKDLLYAFFYLLAIFHYLEYLRRKHWQPYAGAIICGILSLLAKPMALSLPLILFLLDWFHGRTFNRRSILEKIPFFLYIIPLTWLTYALHVRNPISNFIDAVLTWTWTFNFYLWKFIWPAVLVPVYHIPDPVGLQNPLYIFSAGFFAVFIFLLTRYRKYRWWVFSAVFYFLSIFFLLRFDHAKDINIVADRFMYLPSLGFCILLGLAAAKFLECVQKRNNFLSVAGTALVWLAVISLGFKSAAQTMIWNNTITLWTHVIKYNPTEFLAYNDRAVGYIQKDFYDLGIKDYSSILEFDPDNADAYFNRGLAYKKIEKYADAITDFNEVIRQYPYYEKAYYHRGIAYEAMGNESLALNDYTKTIEVSPAFADGYLNRGNIFNAKGDLVQALRDYNQAILLNPRFERAINNRGIIFAKENKAQKALDDFNEAIVLDLNYAEAYYNRSVIYQRLDQPMKALADALKAKELGAEVPDSYIHELKQSASI